MSSVPSEVSKYMGNAVKLAEIWGSIIYNVKALPYSAKGDGVTDDSIAIQAAINAASQAGGGVVKFQHGTYIAKNLLIPSNICLIGDYGSTIIKLPANVPAGTCIVKNSNSTSGNTNILVDGIILDGNRTNQTNSSFGFFFDKCKYTTVQNCTVQNLQGFFGAGLVYTGENASQYNRALNCNFLNLIGCDAMFVQGIGHLVHGCYVDGVGDTGVALDATTDVRIIGNVFKNCAAQAVGTSGSTFYAVISDNVMESNRIGVNLYYQSSPITPLSNKYITIKGNHIINCTLKGMYIAATHADPSNSIVIEGNIILSAASRGIELVYCKSCTIINNTIKKCGDAGIFVNASSHIKIQGNTSNDNVTAGIYMAASPTDNNLFSIISNNLCTNEITPIAQSYGIILTDSGAVSDYQFCLISNNVLKNNSVSLSPGASIYNTTANNIV